MKWAATAALSTATIYLEAVEVSLVPSHLEYFELCMDPLLLKTRYGRSRRFIQ